MKFPNHIILDVSKTLISNSNQYWIFKYVFALKNKTHIFQELTFHKKFFMKKTNLFLNKLTANQQKFTLKHNLSNSFSLLPLSQKNFINKIYEPKIKVKHKLLESKFFDKEIFDFFKNSSNSFDEKTFKRLIRNFNPSFTNNNFKSNNLWSLFNINFLRKEKIYTKLKYSRVPQYDIVSGGAAALLGGFLGFLITEKFGFELVDSGDFYYLFMYLVFLFFSCRLFLKIINSEKMTWNILSLKWLIFFYETLTILFINFIKKFINKIN